ncbi:MAG: NAD-dependent epimerase/dehydratase family protein [Gemmataceae bacterium]
MALRLLVTGATGFVGGHVAEAAVKRGHAVRTIARPGSAIAALDDLGVTILHGDLIDPEVIRQAVEGIDAVVHCAAKVGDWGPVSDYRAVNVEALRQLLEACYGQPLQRFVHISSLGVYAARHHHGTDETEPLPARHMDGYTQTKVEAEQLALDAHRLHGTPVVVLRPGFVYGPRDRTVLPQLADKLRRRYVRYIGDGSAAMNTIYVGNLVEAIFLALEKPEAVGQVYNLTDGDHVSKRKFFETIADGLGLPRPRRGVPLAVAKFLARVLEGAARRRGKKTAPRLTQARLKLLGLNLDFSIEKAKRELGYAPTVSFDQAMPETLEWFKTQSV